MPAYDGQAAATASAWSAGNMLFVCELTCTSLAQVTSWPAGRLSISLVAGDECRPAQFCCVQYILQQQLQALMTSQTPAYRR